MLFVKGRTKLPYKDIFSGKACVKEIGKQDLSWTTRMERKREGQKQTRQEAAIMASSSNKFVLFLIQVTKNNLGQPIIASFSFVDPLIN